MSHICSLKRDVLVFLKITNKKNYIFKYANIKSIVFFTFSFVSKVEAVSSFDFGFKL